MKNIKFLSGLVLLTGYAILIFLIATNPRHTQSEPNIQQASIIPEWIVKDATARGYNIERKYAYGKTFFILVDGGGNPIQMIAYE